MRLSRLYLVLRAIPKTLLFNLYYFGLHGLRLPVLVSHRVKLSRLYGKVEVPADARTAAIRIGFGNVVIFDQNRSRTLWHNLGVIRFLGQASIGHGSRISVSPTGSIVFGDRYSMIAESTLVSSRAITFGAGCLVSWQVLVMDQDFHPLYDERGNRTNCNAPVIFGDHVWIGCRSVILKGSTIPPGSVIAAGSTVSAQFPGSDLLIGGQPGRVLRSGIRWAIDDVPQQPSVPEYHNITVSSAVR